MVKLIDFNINHSVKVKLTDHGRNRLRLNHKRLMDVIPGGQYAYRPPKEDEDGVSDWQLWRLMSELGEYMYMGGESLFDTNIQFVTEGED